MIEQRSWKGWRGLLILLITLASGLGCNAFAPPSPTPYQVVIIAPNESPVPTPTPLPSATPTDTPTITPTATPSPSPTATPTITPTPTITLTPSQTFTPSITPTPQPIDSAVCRTCQPNLRESPGTAGKIVTRLDETYQFTAVGRTEDSKWLQVVLKNDKRGRQGWLFRDLTALREADVSRLPVTGSAIDATEPPPQPAGAAAPVSGVTSKSREIFLRGERLGNRPFVFTRVGDSITASPYFLTPCGSAGADLGSYHNQLYEVVNYFRGSFARASLAAGNGWGADRILQPGYNAPDVCGSDSPLVCEYRLAKPSVALIMIGTNDSGGVEPGVYEANLRRIVEISIEMGVIPVLSTIPPKRNTDWNAQRAEQWNAIIRGVARQYDIPLWDYWLALQTAPGLGLSEDGIHPSAPPDGATCSLTPENLQYGYTIRNLTALQMLNALWRNVLY